MSAWPYFFGARKEPCIDCTELQGETLCTMNCGPCLPPDLDKPPPIIKRRQPHTKDKTDE